MEKAKEKKEFNGARIARQAEKALKSVFPKAKFFVSEGKPVEAITLDINGYTEQEMGTFRHVFCTLSKIDQADFVVTRAKRETAEEKKPVAAAPAK